MGPLYFLVTGAFPVVVGIDLLLLLFAPNFQLLQALARFVMHEGMDNQHITISASKALPCKTM